MIYLSIILVIASVLLLVYAIRYNPAKELKVVKINSQYYIKSGNTFIVIANDSRRGYTECEKEYTGSYYYDDTLAEANEIARRIRDGYNQENVIATIPIDKNRPEDNFLKQLREHLELARKHNDVDEINRIQNSINLRNGQD